MNANFFMVLNMPGRPRPPDNIVHLFSCAGGDFLGHVLSGGNLSDLRRYPSGKVRAAGDQPRSALVGNVGPRPLNENQKAIAEPDQEEDVHEQPPEPSDES